MNSFTKYQRVVQEKENAIVEMKMIFKDSKKLVAKKIDKFALQFESTNPAFFNEYRRVREKQLH